MLQNHYNYIITGAGCAGLSLAMHLVQHKELRQKKILLVDQSAKNQNDRTWCFWEDEIGLFESIVFRKWDRLWFYSDDFSGALRIAPYHYKMIRGIDFYNYCFNELKKHAGVEFLQGNVETIFSGDTTGVVVNGKTITSDYVFNSILFDKPSLKKSDVWLLQHFKGWLIETETQVFNENEPTLMDFRISQERGTAFCYVLPFSGTKALVEYTLFTPELLQQQEYEQGLKAYIGDVLNVKDYAVEETEFGVIPMTNHRFSSRHNNIISIGTAGGQTKGSSGYTFYFVQQHSKKIANSLLRDGHPFVSETPRRFRFYDSVLLQVLAKNLLPGNKVFSTMFKKNQTKDVLAFLNNASTLSTELHLVSTLPTYPFFKAAAQQLL